MDEGTGGALGSQTARAGGPAGVGAALGRPVTHQEHSLQCTTCLWCRNDSGFAKRRHRPRSQSTELCTRGASASRGGQSLTSPVIPPPAHSTAVKTWGHKAYRSSRGPATSTPGCGRLRLPRGFSTVDRNAADHLILLKWTLRR